MSVGVWSLLTTQDIIGKQSRRHNISPRAMHGVEVGSVAVINYMHMHVQTKNVAFSSDVAIPKIIIISYISYLSHRT